MRPDALRRSLHEVVSGALSHDETAERFAAFLFALGAAELAVRIRPRRRGHD